MFRIKEQYKGQKKFNKLVKISFSNKPDRLDVSHHRVNNLLCNKIGGKPGDQQNDKAFYYNLPGRLG